MSKVLVTGATGLLGVELCKMLSSKGLEVLVLSRGESKSMEYKIFGWNLQKEYINEQVFAQKIDYVIHLAGAGVADKTWTNARKKEIISSRVDSIRLLTKYLEKLSVRPKAFISASAIGIYGNRPGDDFLDESSAIHPDSPEFLVQTCVLWEGALAGIQKLGIRTAILRIGIVLSSQGGALAKMLPSYRFGIGAYFGNGQQYYSWVHIEDICRMFLFLLENESAQGVYNGVSPHPVHNKELASAIGEAKGQRPLLLPAPQFAIKMAMGEMSAIVFDSARVLPKRLSEAGFEFKFPDLLPALKDLFARNL